MAQALPEICRDGPDVDRVAFHAFLDTQVVAFFSQHLKPGHAP